MTQDTGGRQDEALKRYLGSIQKDQKQAEPIVGRGERVLTGLQLGVLVGLAYGVISQSINGWRMPGIPLAHPPIGQLGNIMLYVLAGALIGVATALPKGGTMGAAAGAALGSVLLQLYARLAGLTEVIAAAWGAATSMFVAVVSFGYTFVMMLVVLLLLRWAIEVVGERKGRRALDGLRLRAVAAPILLAAAVGLLSMYSPPDRDAVELMHNYTQRNLTAITTDEMTAPFNVETVAAFMQRPGDSYVLKPDRRLVQLLPGATLNNTDTAVAAVFGRSYVVICGFKEGHPTACADWLAWPGQD